jgi:hypothetical protein
VAADVARYNIAQVLSVLALVLIKRVAEATALQFHRRPLDR